MADRFKLRGIYGKPLTKGSPLEDDGDRSALLDATGKEAINAIQKEISRYTFKRSPSDLLKSFTYEVKGKSTLIIKSGHPAAKYLDKGVKPYQMTHLVKATRPIPIITDKGELIFRTATKKGMQAGKWKHPGIQARNFLDRGIDAARQTIKDQISSDVKNAVLSRFKGK